MESPGEKKYIGEQNVSEVGPVGGAAIRPDNSQPVSNFRAPGPWGILTPGMLLISSQRGFLRVGVQECDGGYEMGGVRKFSSRRITFTWARDPWENLKVALNGNDESSGQLTKTPEANASSTMTHDPTEPQPVTDRSRRSG